MTFTVQSFEIEHSSNCTYDEVTVSADGSQVRCFCSNMTGNVKLLDLNSKSSKGGMTKWSTSGFDDVELLNIFQTVRTICIIHLSL